MIDADRVYPSERRTNIARAVVAAALVSGLFATSRPARADGGDSATAEVLFREGKRLMEEGDLGRACPKLAESYRLDPATGALLATALCYERSGKLASAWVAYTDAAARAKREGNTDREQGARARAAALEAKVPKLVISVDTAAAVEGLTLTRDGIAVGEAAWRTPIPVDPGEHVIEARAPGKQTYRTVVSATSGELRVRIRPLEDAGPGIAEPSAPVPVADPLSPLPEPAPAPRRAEAVESRFWSPLRIAGVASAGVGLVGLGIGSVFGIRAISYKNESDEDCDDNDYCGDNAFDERLEARKAGNVSTIAFAAGAVAVAAGATLFLLGDPEGSQTGLWLQPYTAGVGGQLSGRF